MGVVVVTKVCKFRRLVVAGVSALALLVLAGCGGGTKTNVITVTVTPSATVIVSQSITLTATVTGATDTTISNWTCQYLTTSFDSAGKQTAGTKTNCTDKTGNIPASGNTNTTVVFTAPAKVPDPTDHTILTGSNCTASSAACDFSILITAIATADPNQKGKLNPATLHLDSGIVVGITPSTATVPTDERQHFTATLTNDNDTTLNGVTWLVTQDTTSTTSFPAKPTCSPGCGSISSDTAKTATFTAPHTLPTTTTLTVVAVSKADATRFATASVSLVTSGPITFNGISPTVVPQGAALYDIYLDAPNATSSTFITLTGATSGTKTINSDSGQLKVLFPIPNSTTTNPTSTGIRLRLTQDDLLTADTFTIAMFDPATSVCPAAGCPLGSGPFAFEIRPVRPSSVASIPDSVLLKPPASLPNDQSLAIDGGYFGSQGRLVNVVGFSGNSLIPGPTTSSSRRLNVALPSSEIGSSLPGLYSISVVSTASPAPSPNNPSVTNMAIFPDYSVNQPTVATANLAANANPNAVDVDTKLGILAVAETGANTVEFFNIGNNSLSSLSTQTVTKPTGLSINQSNHTVAVVSGQDQLVKVFPLPGQTGDPNVTYPLSISLTGLIPGNVSPAPVPYSIGVDSDTNNAIVAYSSSAAPTTAKVGFLLDLNKNSAQVCIDGSAGSPCVHAQVTLNAGSYPQIAMVPHAHTAFVTPGGAGVLSGVDVTKASSSVAISSLSLTSGLVTVLTSTAHGLTPGNAGTVLIKGVPAPNDFFNGVFTVLSVIDSTTFTFALNNSTNTTEPVTCPTDPNDPTDLTKNPCQVFFSSPNIAVGVSQTSQGIAINPITRTAAIADANATGNSPQINLLNSLDQSQSSISFHTGCTTAYITNCNSGPELLGTSSVAFQPYSNALVSYNPQQNQLSVSSPVSLARFALLEQLDPALNAPITLPTVTVGGSTLTLFGGVAVDPATNQAFVAESAGNKIQIVSLGPLKSAQISELQVPTVAGATIGGIPGALMPQGTLTSSSPLAGVKIFGSGFDAGSQVRLDETVVSSTRISDREIDFTVPASFLTLPHRFAVDVKTSTGVLSNATDFFVIKAVDMSKTSGKPACKDSGGNGLDAQPNSVAIADQLPGQPFTPIAVVTNTGCNNVSIIDINPENAGSTFGTVTNSIPTGTAPQGIAVSPRFGVAVVANHTDGTASVLDLKTLTQKGAAVTVGTTPTGVAINEGTGAAIVAVTGSHTISEIDLTQSTLSSKTLPIDQSPIAVAIDPDRGTNNRGLAVVTALQLIGGSSPIGALDAIDIGGATPVKSTTGSVSNVSATPTGLVFDPSTALFYAVSSGGNVVSAFNPDTGGTSSIRVGINPTSLAINPQTGGIMTINAVGQTVSIIDTVSNPFKTRSTFGIGGSSQFGVAIDQFLNLAVIVDQANNRVLIFPMPN